MVGEIRFNRGVPVREKTLTRSGAIGVLNRGVLRSAWNLLSKPGKGLRVSLRDILVKADSPEARDVLKRAQSDEYLQRELAKTIIVREKGWAKIGILTRKQANRVLRRAEIRRQLNMRTIQEINPHSACSTVFTLRDILKKAGTEEARELLTRPSLEDFGVVSDGEMAINGKVAKYQAVLVKLTPRLREILNENGDVFSFQVREADDNVITGFTYPALERMLKAVKERTSFRDIIIPTEELALGIEINLRHLLLFYGIGWFYIQGNSDSKMARYVQVSGWENALGMKSLPQVAERLISDTDGDVGIIFCRVIPPQA